jgi:hypothetical protein
MNKEEILAIEFESWDLNRKLTIRNYLKELLKTLWKEGDTFSGKHPFGNSGWQFDVYFHLIKYKLINGNIDDDNHIIEIDEESGRKLILELIESL